MRAVRISKLLSLGLRHQPEVLGVTLDPQGWADVNGVIDGLARVLAERNEATITEEELEEIVATSDKQRFAISPDGTRIRANQGHSVNVDLGLPARQPPEVLYHGTTARFIDSIRKSGIERRARTHVHLSTDLDTARSVANRRAGEKVILTVHAKAMHDAGYSFYLSENGVWLTERAPPEFIDPATLLY